MSLQILLNGVVAGCLYAMLALGFSAIYSSMRFFNMSHGAIMLTGAFAAYVFGKNFNLPFPACVVAGAVVATVIHVAIAGAIYLPMRRRKAGMWVVSIASLGVASIIEAVVALLFGTRSLSIRPGYIPTTLTFFGGSVRISTVDVAVMLLAVACVVVLSLFLKRTVVGTAVRAITCDREMAEVAGVHTARVELAVYSIGAGMAGLAGAMLALQGPVVYSMAGVNLLKAIVVSILGIQWGVLGVVVGGPLLGIVENGTVAVAGAQWREAVSLLVLVAYVWLIAIVEIRKKYK